MPLIRNTNTNMTDTGTRDPNINLTTNNGAIKYQNKLTGTERYGYKTPDSTYYPGSTTTQNNLRNLYNNTTNNSSYNNGGSNNSNNTGYSTHEVRTTNDDIISKIKALLNQQKEASDAYAKSLYENQLNQIIQNTESNRNQANLNRARTDRYIQGLYGNGVSGQGLSNRARNVSNWQNNLANIRSSDATMRNDALARYNANLANNAQTLASGWYNYVLPVYTDRQRYLDSLEFNNSHHV